MEKNTARIEGHALVEIMGHQSTSGYVTTEAFGSAVFFHVVAPEEAGPEETVSTRTYLNGEYLLPGSRIRRRRLAVNQWIGESSIYRITMCSAQTAQEHQKVVVEIVERAAAPQLEASPDASEAPTQINVELLYTQLTGLLGLSEYDEGVKDALGWVLRREPRPQLDVDKEEPDPMDDLLNAEQPSEYTGF